MCDKTCKMFAQLGITACGGCCGREKRTKTIKPNNNECVIINLHKEVDK